MLSIGATCGGGGGEVYNRRDAEKQPAVTYAPYNKYEGKKKINIRVFNYFFLTENRAVFMKGYESIKKSIKSKKKN